MIVRLFQRERNILPRTLLDRLWRAARGQFATGLKEAEE
jgi:hypothetical protein